MSVLYIVPTPIGNLDDMVPRGLTVLQQVDRIAAEDTRHSARLMAHFGITTPMLAYHEHNETAQCEYLLSLLAKGESIALISDAGTPLISDPGYRLVNMAVKHNIKVVPIPGPVAAMVALSASGLPSDRFCFEGFLPHKRTKRIKQLEALASETRTMIFYESPHRIVDCLEDMKRVFGRARVVGIARELTKQFETLKTDTLEQLLVWMLDDSNQQRGEFVVLVEGQAKLENNNCGDAYVLLEKLAKELPPNRAAAIVADVSGLKKRDLYRHLLALGADSDC